MRLHTDEEMVTILDNIWKNDIIINTLKKCWTSISNKEVDVDNIFHRYLDSEDFEINQTETEIQGEINKDEQIDWHITDLKMKLCHDIEYFAGVADIMDCSPFDTL